MISSHEINIDDKVNTKHEEIVFCHSNFVEKVKKKTNKQKYIFPIVFFHSNFLERAKKTKIYVFSVVKERKRDFVKRELSRSPINEFKYEPRKRNLKEFTQTTELTCTKP